LAYQWKEHKATKFIFDYRQLFFLWLVGLALIAFSSTIDYLVGIGLGRIENATKRKLLLLTSIAVNIGFLGFFKYFNLGLDNFREDFLSVK